MEENRALSLNIPESSSSSQELQRFLNDVLDGALGFASMLIGYPRRSINLGGFLDDFHEMISLSVRAPKKPFIVLAPLLTHDRL